MAGKISMAKYDANQLGWPKVANTRAWTSWIQQEALNSPRKIFTLSPFTTGKLLFPYFFRNSLLKLDAIIFLLTFIGALNLCFLCFLGCLLPFHDFENICFMSHHHFRDFSYKRISISCFFCNRSFNLCSFRISFLIF